MLLLLEQPAHAGCLNDHHRDGVRDDVVQFSRDARALVGRCLLRDQPELTLLLDPTAKEAFDSAEECGFTARDRSAVCTRCASSAEGNARSSSRTTHFRRIPTPGPGTLARLGAGVPQPRPPYSSQMDEFPDLGSMKSIAEAVASEWGVELGEPFALSRYSYVAPVGADSVLKVAWAGDDESLHEADSLALWAGDGAVRLLRHDPSRRALLEERALPGDDPSALAGGAGARDRRRRRAPALAPRGPSRSAGSAITSPRGSTTASAQATRAASSSHSLASCSRSSRSAARLSSTATSITTTSSATAIATWRSTARRCSAIRSTTCRRFSGTRCRTGSPTRRKPSAGSPRSLAAGLDEWKIRAWTVIRASYLGADPEEAALIRALVR